MKDEEPYRDPATLAATLDGWVLAVIDSTSAYLGKPRLGAENILGPVYMLSSLMQPDKGGMRVMRAVTPVLWLADVDELDVSGHAIIPLYKIGPGLVATFAKEVEKIRGFLPVLRSSEFGE